MKTKCSKLISTVLLCVILICSIAVSAKAALSVWYSDSDTIGTWKGTQVKFGQKKLNSNSNFHFYDAGLYAIDQWENALNISIDNVLLMSSANIKCYGGTVEEIISIGLPNLDYALGYAYPTSFKTLWSETINGKKVYVLQYLEALMVIYDKRTYQTNAYNSTATHELGHALGWDGHSSVSTDIMYTSSGSKTTLTYRDIDHLKQVY